MVREYRGETSRVQCGAAVTPQISPMRLAVAGLEHRYRRLVGASCVASISETDIFDRQVVAGLPKSPYCVHRETGKV
jgi:hypothetical protein